MAAQVPDELWNDFHTVVNMTSRELEEWLRVREAGEETEEYPDQAGTPTGRQVLEILGKRRTDLTERDAKVMRRVVDRVHAERNAELDPKSGQAPWRHRLMTIGHDPLRPA